MCKICDNDVLTDLKFIDCSNCMTLTMMPIIEGVAELNCLGCKLLTSVQLYQD